MASGLKICKYLEMYWTDNNEKCIEVFKKYLTPPVKTGRNINTLNYPFCDSHFKEVSTLIPDEE
jgi:hypothetical protein